MQNYAQIQKAVINILLEQVLYNEPDNDLIKQVKGHCPDGTHREKLRVYLDNYFLRNYMGNDQFSIEAQVAFECIRERLERNDSIISNLEKKFMPAQIKKPVFMPSVSSS